MLRRSRPGGRGGRGRADRADRGGRDRGARARLPILAVAAAAVVAVTTVVAIAGPAEAGAVERSAPQQVLAVATIESEQAAVVARGYTGLLAAARFAVADFSSVASGDDGRLRAASSTQAAAAASEAADSARLGTDLAGLAAVTEAGQRADAALAADRDRLRAIALGLYVGDLTNPQPGGGEAPAAFQRAVFDATEVDLVSTAVDRTLAADHAAAVADARRRHQMQATVHGDDIRLSAARAATAQATGAVSAAESTLAADQARLASAQHHLGQVQARLAAAVRAVGPAPGTPAGSLGLLGGAALDAAQLTGWFSAQGYTDMTTAPIDRLAQWYLDAGRALGVRGDVAFAQAVLETGGFASPDAIGLSNFAGIGHCDTCAQGWAFPSPQGGVVGHVQLLRIFADRAPAPAGAPAPVLAALTPAKQAEAGCCSTVESLTGVWATDPTYGQQILGLYQSMLDYALSVPLT